MTDIGGISGDPRWQTAWTDLPTREDVSQPGALRIDRDKIPQAIALFSGIKERIGKLSAEAEHALRIDPMAEDRVSEYIAEVLTAKGLTEPECALSAITAFRDQLQGIIDRLEDTQRLITATEEANRQGFRGGPRG
ncbi:hypothetical protein [Allokutzneria sp. NRRL B-24872]|uniref:hypothetical protein n=1 Tax=Allokutzneria sp. NRRL B-24872 TaxID=1137961 RepID=UPI000A3BB166|nr:hypothetical protein [Allokutzneria sp. NRRL B-24872]